jgi:hypothetical protein
VPMISLIRELPDPQSFQRQGRGLPPIIPFW